MFKLPSIMRFICLSVQPLLQLPQDDKRPGNGAPLVGILKNGNVTPTPSAPATPQAATKNGDIATRIEEEEEEEDVEQPKEQQPQQQQEAQQQLKEPQQQLLNLAATDVAATNGASRKNLLKSHAKKL